MFPSIPSSAAEDGKPFHSLPFSIPFFSLATHHPSVKVHSAKPRDQTVWKSWPSPREQVSSRDSFRSSVRSARPASVVRDPPVLPDSRPRSRSARRSAAGEDFPEASDSPSPQSQSHHHPLPPSHPRRPSCCCCAGNGWSVGNAVPGPVDCCSGNAAGNLRWGRHHRSGKRRVDRRWTDSGCCWCSSGCSDSRSSLRLLLLRRSFPRKRNASAETKKKKKKRNDDRTSSNLRRQQQQRGGPPDRRQHGSDSDPRVPGCLPVRP